MPSLVNYAQALIVLVILGGIGITSYRAINATKENHVSNIFRQYDTNIDDVISPDEYPKTFEQFDADSSGTLDRKEFRKAFF